MPLYKNKYRTTPIRWKIGETEIQMKFSNKN